jgi:hypothetical protein
MGNCLFDDLTSEDAKFWLRASQASLDAIWSNPEDDIYGQLLKP